MRVAKETTDYTPALAAPITPRLHAFTAVFAETGPTTKLHSKNQYIIGRADLSDNGYTPCPIFGRFPSYEKASDYADGLNKALGLSVDDAARIIGSTMNIGRDAQKSDWTEIERICEDFIDNPIDEIDFANEILEIAKRNTGE